MSRGPDAATLVQRAVLRSARGAGSAITIAAARSTRWASGTFTGARHHMTLEGEDNAVLSEWLGALGEVDLPIRGHLVADMAVISITRIAGRAVIAIEALTVET